MKRPVVKLTWEEIYCCSHTTAFQKPTTEALKAVQTSALEKLPLQWSRWSHSETQQCCNKQGQKWGPCTIQLMSIFELTWTTCEDPMCECLIVQDLVLCTAELTFFFQTAESTCEYPQEHTDSTSHWQSHGNSITKAHQSEQEGTYNCPPNQTCIWP